MQTEIYLKEGKTLLPNIISKDSAEIFIIDHSKSEILFITSYPPIECGIATYSNDLIKALNNKIQ